MTSTTTTTLHHLAALAAERLSPPPRATHTAATLRQIGDLVDGHDLPPMVPGDLAAALSYVGIERLGDAPPVSARRATCRELAALASQLAESRADEPAAYPRTVVAVWRAAADLLSSEDPRQAAIATTLRREAQELGEHFG